MSSLIGRMFNVSKDKGIGNRGSRVRVLIRTIYYIVIKVFSFKKEKLKWSLFFP